MEYYQPPLDIMLSIYRTVVFDGITWPAVVSVSAHNEGPLGLNVFMDVGVSGRGAIIRNVTLPRLHFLNLDALWPTILMAAHHGLIEYAVPTRELAETKRGPFLAKHIRAAASRRIFEGFDEGDQTAADGVVQVFDHLYFPERGVSDLAQDLGYTSSHVRRLLHDGRRRQRAATQRVLKKRSDPKQLELFGGADAVLGEEALRVMDAHGLSQNKVARVLGVDRKTLRKRLDAAPNITSPW